MLNYRGLVVLTCIALLAAAFISSARADQENFGGSNVHSNYSGGVRGIASHRGSTSLRQIQRRNAAQTYIPDEVGSGDHLVRSNERRGWRGWHDGIGPKPRAWCGWWMQHHTGVTSAATGLNLNRAIEWARAGSPGSGASGDILVERNHVSKITGPGSRVGCYMTISGNVNNTVAPLERCRWVALRRV